ncbi:MAG: tRNA lysidine(34) synthetase TilS [Proteobacteria bacterium]|nr:tRNA lysidine(34) synthetase TilS [Pseudomonadota bacterium]
MKPDIFFAKVEFLLAKSSPKKIAVAVSGGSDSLALTLLLKEFCSKKAIKLFAITVDHKIRESSSQEAAELNKFLIKQKIPHQIFSVPSKKIPQKNIEAKLREIRYALLQEFCTKNEIDFLFLGHHRGDVAENFLIRLFRGSGLDGLSTMKEIVEINKIRLVRPLLDFEKDDLKKFLRAKKVKWFEDETNSDEKFLRNKIRNFLATLPEKKLIEQRIKNSSDEIAKMRDFFDEVMWHETNGIVLFEKDMVLIHRQKFRELNQSIALKILAFSLMKIGGKNYKPRREKLERFYQYLIAKDVLKPREFYGCVAKKFDKENVVILPGSPPARG